MVVKQNKELSRPSRFANRGDGRGRGGREGRGYGTEKSLVSGPTDQLNDPPPPFLVARGYTSSRMPRTSSTTIYIHCTTRDWIQGKLRRILLRFESPVDPSAALTKEGTGMTSARADTNFLREI